MMDLKTFMSQMLTPGTVPCTLFGAALGLIFAVLCLTVGVGRGAADCAFLPDRCDYRRRKG